MQIVINIPTELYERLMESNADDFDGFIEGELVGFIQNGTPLPKGHGRLIDADKLYGDFIDGTEGYDCQTWNRIEIGEIIEDAPTIIEADTESEG